MQHPRCAVGLPAIINSKKLLFMIWLSGHLGQHTKGEQPNLRRRDVRLDR